MPIAEGQTPLPVKAECDSSTQVEVAVLLPATHNDRNDRGSTPPSPSKRDETPGTGDLEAADTAQTHIDRNDREPHPLPGTRVEVAVNSVNPQHLIVDPPMP